MMTLIDHANAIQQKIDDAYAEGLHSTSNGKCYQRLFCEDISNAIPYENGLKLDSRMLWVLKFRFSLLRNERTITTYTTVCAQQIRQLIRFIRGNLPKLKILQLSLPRLRTAFTAASDSIKKTPEREQTLSRTL